MPAVSSRMGRPRVLTREAIVHAVLDVGFADLTVAAVRQRLGVGQTTLYRYAADRDELVRIGLSHVLEQAPWPSTAGPWRTVMRRYARAMWTLWEAHPGSAAEVARGVIPLGAMPLIDDLCAVLIRQGFTAGDAILACDIVFDMVTDSRANVEQLVTRDPNAGGEHLREHGGEYPNRVEEPADRAATDDERRAIREAMAEAYGADPLEWMTRKLEVILDGVERSAARTLRSAPP
ncbi:MAG: TetR family transcriptional regulator [Gordonia sp. (in: high G+C Gram-positive bacteria)]|uniref:TetR/AcrR family transcriptional regulator n=1 Tax=Gordonia sp. (in: high G+C Gram-positive bacteria) TaxID=84139 RepID=UPI0039E56317